MSDVLQGFCRRMDGSKVDGTVTISSSWNNRTTTPKNGAYMLDFGGKVGGSVTIYVDSKKYATVTVSGTTKLDITL